MPQSLMARQIMGFLTKTVKPEGCANNGISGLFILHIKKKVNKTIILLIRKVAQGSKLQSRILGSSCKLQSPDTSMDMAGTQILHTKKEVSDMIRLLLLPIFKYLGIIAC